MAAPREEVRHQVRAAHVEVREVRRVGLVDVVVYFEERDVRLGYDRLEELVRRMLVERAGEEVRDYGTEYSELCSKKKSNSLARGRNVE